MSLRKCEVFFCSAWALLFFMAALSCSSAKRKRHPDEVIRVSSVTVEENVLEESLSNFGTVSYSSKNDVTAMVSGTIAELFVKEGSEVKKGQRLAVLKNVQLEIENQQHRISYNSALSSLEVARTRLEEERLAVEGRILSLERSALTISQKELELEALYKSFENRLALHQLGGVTDADIEHSELEISAFETELAILKKEREISSLGMRREDLLAAGIVPSENEPELKEQLIRLNLRSSEAELAAVEAQVQAAAQQVVASDKLLEELIVLAPVSGIIGGSYFERGEYVRENEKLVSIIDTESVFAVFYVQEQDMVSFMKGAKVAVSIPSVNEEQESVIKEISPVADAQSGNFIVKAGLENPGGVLKPGMFVKCSLRKGDGRPYPLVPETVLLSGAEENKSKLFCVVNDRIVSKTVEFAAHKNGMLWISSGVMPGDVVIDRPSPFLKDGQKVEIM